jgi:hypothetical protein
VFAFDKFVMLALYDHDGHADLRQIARGVVGLRLLHQGDGFDEGFEVLGRSL